ncbi:MAG: spore coat protein U domain-containing protein [Alcanivorax sp.]|jgi:spore coat protein U-like protein|uniref:Csu type fimbrial protein n=1 Tax=Alcanivorax sp. TaxID=1872427 RepID=UPI0032D919AF
MKKLITASAMTAALLGAPLASQAETETDTFEVLLTLLASCTIDQATDMDFGTRTEAAVNAGGITSTSTVSVTCSTGTAYDIGLSGTNGSRAMTTAAGSSVAYELYQPDNSTAWDDVSVVSDTGDSTQQDFTVNGLIPAQTATVAGGDNIDGDTGIDLSDTVTVTVTF